LSSELAKNEIEWEPRVDLNEGINETIRWYESNLWE